MGNAVELYGVHGAPTTPIFIDGAKAIDLLREVVKGREEFVYEMPLGEACVYQNEGEPSCLVGCALAKAGVTLDELAEMDAQSYQGIDAVDLPDRLKVTEDARTVFSKAQGIQDSGNKWHEALFVAEREADYLGVIAL